MSFEHKILIGFQDDSIQSGFKRANELSSSVAKVLEASPLPDGTFLFLALSESSPNQKVDIEISSNVEAILNAYYGQSIEKLKKFSTVVESKKPIEILKQVATVMDSGDYSIVELKVSRLAGNKGFAFLTSDKTGDFENSQKFAEFYSY